MIQLGQYPQPTHVLAHFSDPHFLAGNRPMFGAVDTEHELVAALDQLERSGVKPKAIVFTGDLADLGEPEAYRRLRSVVEPVADRMGATVVWVMGNHDERLAFRRDLLGGTDRAGGNGSGTNGAGPVDRVLDIDGLRIIAIDTSVPGYHHGELSDAQLEWLGDVLETPAPSGTLLAMHHPPIPSHIELMAVLELQRQERLASVIRGSDIRGILAGHLHYSTHSTFAGIPVSVTSATCYTLDPGAAPDTLSGLAGGRGYDLVRVYEDRVVHASVPLGAPEQVTELSATFLERIASMTPEARLEAFSNKTSTFSVEDTA